MAAKQSTENLISMGIDQQKPTGSLIIGSIPNAITDVEAWVCWSLEQRGDKPTKVPYTPATGERSDTTDPATRGSFRAALTIYEQGRYSGIGFVLAPPFVGVDLDHCIGADGTLAEWAAKIVRLLNSYTEISPSGTGLHIICRGTHPGERRRRGQVEMYSRGRFFTVTGRRWPDTPAGVEERGSELAAVYAEHLADPTPGKPPQADTNGRRARLTDEQIVELAGRARNGEKFAALYRRGDIGAYDSDDSAADMALCGLLAFYTGDPAQLERLMSASALGKREKWHRRADYRKRTIGNALTDCREYYTGDHMAAKTAPASSQWKSGQIDSPQDATSASQQTQSANERLPGLILMADVVPEVVQWLWPARIALAKLCVWEGDPGLGKSVISLDIAARVSTGRAMPDGAFGDLATPAGVVLLTAEDGLADTIRPRLDAAGADSSKIAALRFVRERDGERLPSLADLVQIEQAIVAVDARLVIIDPLMAYLPAEINSYRDQDVRRLLAPLAQLAERTGVALLVIRHLTKGSGTNPIYRGGGSIGIIGAARTAMLVAPDPDDSSGQRRILAVNKSNLAMLPPAMAYHIATAENGAPAVIWEGATAHTAGGLLAVPSDSEGRGALAEAQEFLRDLLNDGAVAAKQVKSQAREAGITDPTLIRAKQALGIRPRKEGFEGSSSKWVWSLPGEDDQVSEDDHTQEHDHLRADDHLRSVAAESESDNRDLGTQMGALLDRQRRRREMTERVFETAD